MARADSMARFRRRVLGPEWRPDLSVTRLATDDSQFRLAVSCRWLNNSMCRPGGMGRLTPSSVRRASKTQPALKVDSQM
jgi:hypothetical protein